MKSPNGVGVDASLIEIYASPVGLFHFDNAERLNADLQAAILSRYRSTPGVISSNRKGWHSTRDMHRWAEPCVGEFAAMVKSAACRWARQVAPKTEHVVTDSWQISSCWSNVNPRGAYNQAHNHIFPKILLSGFYYVGVGDCANPLDAGRTVFQDRSGTPLPFRAGDDPLAREYAVVPKPGVMALFPAALYHYVEPYRGRTLRTSIAFNLANPYFDSVYYPGMAEQSWWWRNFRGFMLLRTMLEQTISKCAGHVGVRIGADTRATMQDNSVARPQKVTAPQAPDPSAPSKRKL